MKKRYVFFAELALLLLIVAAGLLNRCTKKKFVAPEKIVQIPLPAVPKVCSVDTIKNISYEQQLKKVFAINCNECHASPGAGGISLDSYDGCKSLGSSGQLLQVITCAPGDICMPPPPQKMDSCDLKLIQKWVALNYPK